MNFSARTLVFLPFAIFILASAAFLIFLLNQSALEEKSASLQITQAPLFQLSRLKNYPAESFSGDDLRQGKIFIVNVWASWCAPCRAEHPLLMKLSQRKDVIVAGIAYKDAPEDAQRFLERFGNPYDRLGLDQTGHAALGWGIYGVPESFVVDGDGRILFHHRGPITDLAAITNVLDETRR